MDTPVVSAERLGLIFDTVTDGIVVVTDQGSVLFANRAAERMFGRGELIGHELGIPLVGDAEHSDIQLLGRDGLIWAEMRSVVIEWGAAPAQLISIRDVTERHRHEAELDLAAKVFDASREGIVITDTGANIRAVNSTFSQITGYSPTELLGKNPRILQSGQHDAAFYQDMWSAIKEHGYWQGEIWNRRKTGDVYPAMLSITRVISRNGGVLNYVGVFSDLSSQKETETRIKQLSSIDAVTGALNRNVFKMRLSQAIDSATHDGRTFACLLLNIDRMRMINDAYGLSVGDRLLFEFAQRIQGLVQGAGVLARMGSDEFGVILFKAANQSSVSEFATRLKKALLLPICVGDHYITVSSSVGAALFPDDGKDESGLLHSADTALDSARLLGRGTFQFYRQDMNLRAQRWMQLEGRLRGALERHELAVHYQPQVDAVTCSIVGAEALLRWQDAELGSVSPAEFIPVAEQTGLIAEIGAWVLNQACETAAAWHRQGLPPIRVAVNVSGIQLGLGDFAAQVSAVLAKTGLDAQYLEIEITESVMIGGDEKVTESLEKLHRQGVRLALDDFGTGFSSLSYVNEIDFDLLKIDQSFVRKITSEPKAAAIARLTISMAQTMQVTAIAEGVEDEGQLRFLRKLHCGQLQGFLFSPAVPASELEAMLAAGGRFSAYAESEEESGRTLLCVDDEPSVLSSLRRIFRSEGYKTLLASSGQEALELLASNDVQVILADQRMPEMTGTEFFSRVKELYPTTIRVMLSGYAEIDSLTEAVNSGAIFRFLTKPWDSEQLKEQVKLAFTTHEKLNR